PARGEEAPGTGPMGPKLDALLKEPPPGVQVWSACAGGQFSYEYDQATLVDGGVFLSLLVTAFQNGAAGQKPDDAIPLAFLAQQVAPEVEALVRAKEMAAQTPRVTGQESDGGAAYDPAEPVPPRFELPNSSLIAGAAPVTEVEA